MQKKGIRALIEQDRFIGLEHCTWLYSGAETPPLRDCANAVAAYFDFRGKGPAGRARNAEIEQSCKANIAKMLNGNPSDIALLSNSSEIISTIAHSLPFEEGDNVVVHDLEFPSGILPWLLLKNKGLEVRVVHHLNWQVTNDDIMLQVDQRTKMVLTSHVSYLTGARLDYHELYSQLKLTDTLLFLDATQSLGVVPVDMNNADFVVCSSYKWLLSTHGMGILAVNPERTAGFNPCAVGWRSVMDMFGSDRFESFAFHEDARRFELGYPSYPTVYAMNDSTSFLLEQGVERIAQHILSLGSIAIERLHDLGYEVMTPTEPDQRAGNISVVAEDGDAIAQYLSDRNIYIWGGDGRFRVSVHLFNDEDDLERLFEELASYRKQMEERV